MPLSTPPILRSFLRSVCFSLFLFCVLGLTGCGTSERTNPSPAPGTTNNPSPPLGTTTDQFLYAITTNAAGTTGAIAEFHVDANGTLTPLAGSPVALPGAADTITADPLGRFVFVTAGGSVIGFPIDPNTGALGTNFSMPSQATVSNSRLVVHPSGKFLFVEGISAPFAGVFEHEITTYTIATAPAGLQIGTSLKLTPNGFGLAVNPGGNFLYATTVEFITTTVNSIAQMSIDAVTGMLTPVGHFRTDQNAVDLVVHPNGKFLYVGGDGPFVSGSSLDANGAPTLTTESTSLCELTPDFGGQLAISPRGDLLFQATSQDSCVAVHAANQTTGALTFIGSSQRLPFAPGLEGSPGIAVDGSGAFVYAAEAASNTIAGFATATNGALTPLAPSPFRLPSGQLPSPPRYTMAVATVKH